MSPPALGSILRFIKVCGRTFQPIMAHFSERVVLLAVPQRQTHVHNLIYKNVERPDIQAVAPPALSTSAYMAKSQKLGGWIQQNTLKTV